MMGLLGFFGKKDLTYRTFEKWVDATLSADLPEGVKPFVSICMMMERDNGLLKLSAQHPLTLRIVIGHVTRCSITGSSH